MWAWLAAVLGLLAACATDPAVKPWWTLSDESFIPIKPGISKAEVQNLLGKPILEMSFPRLNEDVWDDPAIGLREQGFRVQQGWLLAG